MFLSKDKQRFINFFWIDAEKDFNQNILSMLKKGINRVAKEYSYV